MDRVRLMGGEPVPVGSYEGRVDRDRAGSSSRNEYDDQPWTFQRKVVDSLSGEPLKVGLLVNDA